MPDSNRGGARPGSGPKPKPGQRKLRISFTLPPHQVKWLNEKPNKSKIIQDLIEQEMQKPSSE